MRAAKRDQVTSLERRVGVGLMKSTWNTSFSSISTKKRCVRRRKEGNSIFYIDQTNSMKKCLTLFPQEILCNVVVTTRNWRKSILTSIALSPSSSPTSTKFSTRSSWISWKPWLTKNISIVWPNTPSLIESWLTKKYKQTFRTSDAT